MRALHVGLGALVAGMIPPWQLPYEDGSLADILDHSLIRSSDLIAYTAGFDVDCSRATGLEAELSPGRPVPGAARHVEAARSAPPRRHRSLIRSSTGSSAPLCGAHGQCLLHPVG